MSCLPINVLELNRTFLQIPDTDGEFSSEAMLQLARLSNRAEDWQSLLKHPYVVVLGEAGTGKSTEFSLRARLLAQEGRFAFFIELSELATKGLELSLDIDDETRLERWRQGQNDAVFFLDSLDEAKLQSHTLQQALRQLRRGLRQQWHRVRLVVSCRVSDWMTETDRNELQGIAPQSVSDVYVVQLAPLNSKQVEKLARAAGVTDVIGFIRAVDDSYAHVFIQRPLDVQWLGAYWTSHGQLGNLRELIEANVQEKLKERPSRPSTLTRMTAEAGLQALAGVATINNVWAFILPEETLNIRRVVGAIDPQDFLTDWPSLDVAELLRRPIFDEATYGRVRLHHRSVQEYMAAKWLANLISKGMSRASVRHLFFRQQAGEQAIPVHLRAVVAWLALWDEPLRHLLIEHAPSLLIEHGDPSGFTDDDLQQILRSYAKLFESRTRQFDWFDPASLQRFSAPALSAQIDRLLKTPDTADELASTLLQLVQYGRISSCADTCLERALDLSLASDVRCHAIRTTALVGTSAHRARLLKLIQSTSQWEQDTAGAFIQGLYPESLDVQDLVQVLKSVKPRLKNEMTSLQIVLEQKLPEIGSIELRQVLLRQLLNMIWVFDLDADTHTVPGRHQWLLPMVALLLAALLDDSPENAEWSQGIALAFTVLRWCTANHLDIWPGLDDLKRVIKERPTIRRELFWYRVKEYQRSGGSTPTRYCDIQFSSGLFELSTADREWLITDARTRPEVRERLLAFDALAQTISSKSNQFNQLGLLREVANGIPELTRRLDRMLNPRIYFGARNWALKRRARDLKRKRQEVQNRADLNERIDQIRNGTDFTALKFLYSRAAQGNMSYGEVSAAPIEAEYGVEIAQAAIAGLRVFWRTYDPPIPHERETRNSTTYHVFVGLAGLNLDFEHGLNAAMLDSREARIAARYAACEINAFPAWLENIADMHRDMVAAALAPAVVADMMQIDDQNGSSILAKILRASESVREILTPCVAAQLNNAEPPIVTNLADALDIVIGQHAIVTKDFVQLAQERCQQAIVDPERFAAWWEGWLSVDSVGALDFMEGIVSDFDSAEAYQVVLQVCYRLHQHHEQYKRCDWYTEWPLPARRQPKILTRLFRLIYEQIKPDEDIRHEGAFCFGLRDHAKEIREQLFSWLTDIPGVETVESLRELAEDPLFANRRDWFLHQADQRLATNVAKSDSKVVEVLTKLCKLHGTSMDSNLGELTVSNKMVKIVFLGANPLNSTRLALGDEIREIRQKLRAAQLRDSFELSSRWAVRPSDLQQVLLDEAPTIAHFSGHGGGAIGLVLHSDDMSSDALVTAAALRSLFRLFKDNVRVVVLNACYSTEQATAIVEEIDFVVGMSDAIDDDAARFFAAAFYRGLAFGKSVQMAFDLGVNQLQLSNYIHDATLPVLHVRSGADASTTALA